MSAAAERARIIAIIRNCLDHWQAYRDRHPEDLAWIVAAQIKIDLLEWLLVQIMETDE
jgi:hypothetical protein